jgi:ATP-dependent DNA helicase RecQ
VARHTGDAGIIYCLSRREVEQLATWLQQRGVRALPYHAGLSDSERHAHQDAFLDARVDVIVATVAFGMGIDRPDVRFVVHAGAPRSIEHYQQEAGRAGRDGMPAECVLITSPADFLRWRTLLESTGEFEGQKHHLRDMERFAAATHCRHRALVEYFGQPFPTDACGACDWCLGELERIEGSTTVAQKILSCVARTGQRFGVGHVAGVLAGKASDAIQARRHHELTTFGLLSDCSITEIRSYIDQLAQSGFLVRTAGEYPTLQLTSDGMRLMKGDLDCTLYRQPRRVPRDRQKGKRGTLRSHAEGPAVSESLVTALRELRLGLARERHVPAYVIFHDSTLNELARQRPRTIEQILEVPGIGRTKAEHFGQRVLDVIAQHSGS